MAGVDQAGLVEIIEGIVMGRFSDAAQQRALLRDVFLTGGSALFRGFEERLAGELRGVLPTDFPATVRRAQDPILDAWKGAAGWWTGTSRAERAGATVSRAEYNEKGSEYIKVRVCVFLCHSSRTCVWRLRRADALATGAQSGQLDRNRVRLWELMSAGLLSSRPSHRYGESVTVTVTGYCLVIYTGRPAKLT